MPRSILYLMLLAVLWPSAYADTMLHAHSAWVREAPPGASVLAAYLTIENQGDKTETLVGVSSSDFAGGEIHVTKIENGTASMTHLTGMTIPAHGRQAFAPGGAHLMLMRPRRTLHAGDNVNLRLRFKSGKILSTTAAVVRAEHVPVHQH